MPLISEPIQRHRFLLRLKDFPSPVFVSPYRPTGQFYAACCLLTSPHTYSILHKPRRYQVAAPALRKYLVVRDYLLCASLQTGYHGKSCERTETCMGRWRLTGSGEIEIVFGYHLSSFPRGLTHSILSRRLQCGVHYMTPSAFPVLIYHQLINFSLWQWQFCV